MKKNKQSIPGLRKIIVFIVPVVLASTILSFCGKGGHQAKPPRLVILYGTCTLNKNYLSPYNSGISYTPNFERFAKKSMVFTNHMTEIGQTGPAFASIFSGTQADKHGVYSHPKKLSMDLYLVSEFYNDNGYETFYWNRQKMASPQLNYGQGVKKKKNTFFRLLEGNSPRFLKILQKLKTDKDYRAYVMTNFTVTHSPYKKKYLKTFQQQYPAEVEGITKEDIEKYHPLYLKYRLDLQWNFPETVERLKLSQKDIQKFSKVLELLYKASVNHLDTLFGKLIDQIETFGLWDESLIVFTSDHGEILYRENALFKWTHGAQLVPEVLKVPLIIYSPELKTRPGFYKGISRSIDVFPTMMGLSDLSLPEQAKHINIDGVDLSLPMLGLKPAPNLLAYSHTTVLGRPLEKRVKKWPLLYKTRPRRDPNLIWVSIRDKDMIYKLESLDTIKWNMVAFDLKNDPGETKNLYDPDNPEHKDFEKKLRAYKRKLVKNYFLFERKKGKRISNEEKIKLLRSLGYIH